MQVLFSIRFSQNASGGMIDKLSPVEEFLSKLAVRWLTWRTYY
jgi:hypothetical protein